MELGYAGGTWEKWAPGKTRFGRRNGGVRESTDLEGLQDRGEVRDVKVETRTEESEAGKKEGRWKRRPPGDRSLASVTRLQLPWRIG